MKIKDKPQLKRVVDLVGDFISYWGFKKIHGQIWALIFLKKGPVDANYIIDQLDVSKGLVSLTIKDLLQYKVIEEIAKDKPSTQKYKINENIYQVITEVLVNRERVLLSEIDLAGKLLNKISNEKKQEIDLNTDNLQSLITMTNQAQMFLEAIIKAKDFDLSKLKGSLTDLL